MFHVRTLPSSPSRSKYRIPGAAPLPTPNESRWGKELVNPLRPVWCPTMTSAVTFPKSAILAKLASGGLLRNVYGLLDKARRERVRADPKGEADEGGCEREARVGGVCGGCHAQVSAQSLH
jgi:hypothetical protein